MSYSDLAELATFRPLSGIGVFDAGRERTWSQFSASWSSTVQLLARELRMLYAEQVVLELDMTEADFRLDGLPRANASARTPGVVLSMQTKHGPLRYAVDTYRGWQDNVRAIALALEALRAVDRYGVTRSGEQYAGWKALEAGSGPTAARGRAIIDELFGSVPGALRATHPDTRDPDSGYTDEDFESVQLARGAA